MFRDLLRKMDHLFVQNETSITLLHNIGIRGVTLAGDTRFDRVWALRQSPVALPAIEAALRVEKVLVAGSTGKLTKRLWQNGGMVEGRKEGNWCWRRMRSTKPIWVRSRHYFRTPYAFPGSTAGNRTYW